MFEWIVACKYLVPRRRQLSVSIISVISVLVISLVVWLVLVFFSVTNGLEKSWIEKLVALTAPLRINPTQHYYSSYYYQIDSISEASDYSHRSIGEKLLAEASDPYDPDDDEELPPHWPQKELDESGGLKDPVKEAFKAIEGLKLPGLSASDYEIAFATLNLELSSRSPQTPGESSLLTDAAYLGSFDGADGRLKKTFLPPTEQDLLHLAKRAFERPLLFNEEGALPSDPDWGEGLLLPKSYREAGVLAGDSGYLSYYLPTASAMQEQRLPVFVAGFYDQGVIPIGGKFLLANREIVSTVKSAYDREREPSLASGINIGLSDYRQAEAVKAALASAFKERGIDSYWTLQTYKEYPFTRDLIRQLQSEKNLFMLIAAVIILVACSNIVSMLIILVNDKRREIGVLRAMGASSLSIAAIFGCCGLLMGAAGSLAGIALAALTLRNLPVLLDLIGRLQGHEVFQAAFYGESLPHELSFEALLFVLGATALLSLAAGVIPAVKASRLKPSLILRAES